MTQILRSEFPLSTAAFTRVLQRGHPAMRLYVLYGCVPGEEPQPFAPLIQYFIDTGAMERLPWQRNVARAVGLLLDFLAVRSEGPVDSAPSHVLRAFAETLLSGTAHLGPFESHGLRWPPCSDTRASLYLHLVTAFTDWLSNRMGRVAPNAWRTATPAERLVTVRRHEQHAANALLSHAAYRRHEDIAAGVVREIRIPRRGLSDTAGEVRAFDTAQFQRLLLHGFARRKAGGSALARRFRLREMLMTILMHAGGLRMSELFHLYVGDVAVDPEHPEQASVRVYHPVRGAAPKEAGRAWRNREHYLRERWAMTPRNRVAGRFHAGWKNLALTDGRERYALVHWFPTFWGEVFLTLFRAYLDVRPRGDHPFLFVSERAACRGEPYTIEAFEQSHDRAVRRIGLVPAKHRGTTPHGHRHAYGRALVAAGVDRLRIQRAMHHRSPNSQDVYTVPATAEVSAALRDATQRVWGGDAVPTVLAEILR